MLHSDIAAVLADDAATLALLQDHELTPPVFAELKSLNFPDNLGLLPADAESQASYRMMRLALASFPAQPSSQILDELAADFAAIYLTGAFGASPCESFWLSDDHLVCQEAMFDMRSLYAAAGLAVPDWRKRPDDHLVFQLQFLASRLEVVETDADWRALATFLDFHLLRWLPDFVDRIASRCDTPFYAALAILTDAWCQQLRSLIEHYLGEARPTAEEIEEILRPRRNAEVTEVPMHFVPGGGAPSW